MDMASRPGAAAPSPDEKALAEAREEAQRAGVLAVIDAAAAQAIRKGAAGAIRVQAAALRSLASTLAGEARSLDGIADGIANGTVELPADVVPMKLVPIDEPDEPAEEKDESQGVQAIVAGRHGSSDILLPLGAEEFDPRMAKWLDLFDDRLRMSAHFVTAVNEAADAGREANDETARLVAERVRELTEA